MASRSKVRFTRHASEKIRVLRHYGFMIDRNQIVEAILDPGRLDKRGDQFFATKITGSKHALRVVYERRKDYLVVITFYPVRRERYGL